MFVTLNGHSLHLAADDAVVTMLAVAAGDLDESAVSTWIAARLDLPAG
jgi:prophage maintenance system killer protein